MRGGTDMMAILRFIFTDFWHWLGTALLLLILALWTPVRIRGGKD